MWDASYDAGTIAGRLAGARWPITGWGANCPPGRHCIGAVAAGFAMLGGSVRPEEIAQGHIDHALALLTPATKSGYIACPATNTDGKSSNANAIPEGARVQLDPAFNVDPQSWTAWEKTIAHALQTYGAYVVDTGGAMALYGVTDMNQGNVTWSSVGMTKAPSLFNLPGAASASRNPLLQLDPTYKGNEKRGAAFRASFFVLHFAVPFQPPDDLTPALRCVRSIKLAQISESLVAAFHHASALASGSMESTTSWETSSSPPKPR